MSKCLVAGVAIVAMAYMANAVALTPDLLNAQDKKDIAKYTQRVKEKKPYWAAHEIVLFKGDNAMTSLVRNGETVESKHLYATFYAWKKVSYVIFMNDNNELINDKITFAQDFNDFRTKAFQHGVGEIGEVKFTELCDKIADCKNADYK